MSIRTLIPTCDKHMFVIKAFSHFYNKYWDNAPPVTVLGFNEPDFELPDNFSFFKMADSQQGGAKGWSNYIRDYVSGMEEDRFIFGIDDFCICRPVDVDLFQRLLDLDDPKIGRIDLQPSFQYSRDRTDLTLVEAFDDYDLVSLAQRSTREFIYRITGQFSIWNREYFLRYLEPDMSPHDWELKGGVKAENDGYQILGTLRRHCIKKVELVSDKQYPGKINHMGMRPEDKETVKEIYRDQGMEIGDFKEEYPFSNWEDIVYGS